MLHVWVQMAMIIFKSILSIAGLGNVDGTLGRPNCVKHPGWTFTMTMSSQNVNLRIFCWYLWLVIHGIGQFHVWDPLIFQGLFMSAVKCVVCLKDSRTFDTFSSLTVPLPSHAGRCTLQVINNWILRRLSITLPEIWVISFARYFLTAVYPKFYGACPKVFGCKTT